MKTCSTCKTEKEDSEFIKGRNKCKECFKADEKERVQKYIENAKNITKKCKTCKEDKDGTNFEYGCCNCKDCQREKKRLDKKESYADRKDRYKENAKDIMKTCNVCNEEKDGTHFEYARATCRNCVNELSRECHHRPTEDDPDKECTDCKETKSAMMFRHGTRICRECEKLRLYEWRKKNPEKDCAIGKKYRDKPEVKEKRNEYKRDKYNNDEQEHIRRRHRMHLRDYIHNGKCGDNVQTYIDCSPEFLRQWLEFNFDEGMTWENYGTHWNLDHTKPCSIFDLTMEENKKECFHWSNVVPIIAKENFKKYQKVSDERIEYFKKRAEDFMKSKEEKTSDNVKFKKKPTKPKKKVIA
jgi:hypothetical protein